MEWSKDAVDILVSVNAETKQPGWLSWYSGGLDG
jgi:hypothetical protein